MKWILKSALVLGLPFIFLYAYNYSPIEINIYGFVLKKINTADFKEDSLDNSINSSNVNRTKFSFESLNFNKLNSEDTLSVLKLNNTDTFNSLNSQSTIFNVDTNSNIKLGIPDTSQQRILFIGDSQAGGLVNVLNDYCFENGHKLVATFTWYSATIFNFGYSNKVDELIKKYQPSLIIIVLGLNEMYAKDLAKRTSAANLLKAKIGAIPYLWIGPANYTEDYGINKVYEQIATPNRYVLSKDLNLPKGGDKRHPNREGYRIWMEHVARFIQTSDLYNFKFEIPKKFGYKISGRIITCNAAKERGY
jgi:lysophospholipase L1-like esterase